MSRLRDAIAATVAWSVLAGGAFADPVNLTREAGSDTYLNRPGADMATHDRELRECMVLAANSSQSAIYVYQPSLLGAVVAGAVTGAIAGAQDNAAVRTNSENCMIVRGWRVVQLPADEAQAIAKLDRAGQAAKLKNWVGADTPHGVILRQWGNDAAVGGTVKFERGALLGHASLDFTARDTSSDQPPPKLDTAQSWLSVQLGNARELHGADLDTLPTNHALVIIQIKGTGIRNGDTLIFRRTGQDMNRPARTDDKLPDTLWAHDNWIWHKSGQWYAFEAPPGRWRIDTLTGLGSQIYMSFCLGAPYFDVKAGDVVYAGTFDLSAERPGPDLSLSAAKDWLGAHSVVASALKSAPYVNGSRGRCGGTYIYAYEVPGAPYMDDYGWGGADSSQGGPPAAQPPAGESATLGLSRSAAPDLSPQIGAPAPAPTPSVATDDAQRPTSN
ncbi:MAG TPA: hypothetical protein VHZ26_06660 [Caulobacteraceae bacterium]|jgi:hypothetical protein|nr:hypothetical protein [Caulobacteraceae bacterium]